MRGGGGVVVVVEEERGEDEGWILVSGVGCRVSGVGSWRLGGEGCGLAAGAVAASPSSRRDVPRLRRGSGRREVAREYPVGSRRSAKGGREVGLGRWSDRAE